jgi:hypothetical protein
MAEVKTRSQTRTPAGGMNQDDSLITPTKDMAGRNAFEIGDYRYALNARIGSSRNDSFGDLENIKGTVEVTDYNVYGSLVTNPDFTASLSPWLQLGSDTAWVASGNKARISVSSTLTVTSNKLYQAISPTARKIFISFKYSITAGFSSGVALYVVYLNNTTVLSSSRINAFGINLNETVTSMPLTIPENCNGIGVQMIGLGTTTSVFDLDYFKVNGFIVGARPSGTEKVIGKYEDKEFLKLYYAVYNSLGNYSVRYYDKVTNAVYELLPWTGLAFGIGYFVKFAKLDNWMALTDRHNSPRLVDVDVVSEMYFNLGSSFREFHISLHKWAPVMPPVLRRYYDGSTDNFEKLKNKVFQFSYRYIYKGNLRSCFSPSSVGANSIRTTNITAIEVYAPGIILDDPGAAVQYNYFGHDDVKFTDAVIGIEYAYRESQLDLWRVFKTVDVATSGNTISRFSGPSNSSPVATDDFNQLFDTVPFLAGTVEAVDNRFVFGDCLDEKDAAMKPILTNIGVAQSDGNSGIGTQWSNGALPPSSTFSSLSTADQTEMANRNRVSDWSFKSRGIYKAAIQYMHKDGWISAGYTTDDWSYNIPTSTLVRETENALMFKFADSFKPPDWAVAFQILRTNCLNIDYFMFGVANDFIPLIDNPTQVIDTAFLPQNIKDRIRQHFENSRTVNGYELTAEIEKEEKDLTPFDRAKAVIEQIKSSKNKNEKSLRSYLLKNPIYHGLGPEVRNTITTNLVATCSRVLIDLNNWYNSSFKNSGKTQNNPMNNLYYNFREGDRVRFVGSTSATPNDGQKQIYDVLILEFTGTSLIIEKPEGLLWLPKNDAYINALYDYTIEVYTPKIPQEEDYLYYETGEWYPILYPGTDQRDWSKKDWTYTNNAAVTCTTYGDVKVFNKYPFNKGDCSFFTKSVYRNWDTANNIVVNVISNSMNQNKNETYSEWERGDGRPNISYKQLPVAKFKNTQARFGLKIVEESFINNVNRFLDENQFIYPSEYGRIRDLINTANAQVESAGSILLAIGERESWSIYVNRTTIEDLSGRTQVALSNKVLGSYNTLLGGYGTLNPESICFYRNNVYWWSALNGVWVRYGRDGLTEISFYKMRNWFRELGDLLIDEYQTDDVPLAIADFDPYNEELVTFMDHANLPSTFRGYANYKGALFSEEDTRWKSIHDYTPERFAKLTTQLISFRGGSLYLHEQNEDHSTFYGTKYNVKWEPVFNDDLSLIKAWQALAYIATDRWGVERILSEYRGIKLKQQTSIDISNFIEKEDNLYSAIPRDQNTPNITNPTIEGNMMRSKAIQVLITLDPALLTRTLMHYAIAECEDSPKNP